MEAVRSLMLTQTAEAEGGEQQSATPTPTLVLPTETEAPATLTPVVVIDTPTPEPGGYEEYTVQPGDYLYSIARKFDVDPEDIIAINNLQAPDTLEVGQVLLIPLGDVATGPTRTPITGAQEYIVQAGDWIWSIARKFGLDAQALIDANDLEYPYTVYPGDVLIIP
jgi:LysM repeat protein